ncbi:aminodeoxychorismate lyase [Lacimicrobium alkaliphilum]|uniref:Aminodeoxychorismate lyase n=1 Tax=Lacimicrobium alkaliphilum TaxID=1526571 RepID=A0ABQ1RR55_9ALTE|nr:aminodeoxychorismate lyase [Lacimicrobium alkaliphilum]GGD78346.1 aminodeoxychorismate lyase [Lacimicrobium alkaliphilum]
MTKILINGQPQNSLSAADRAVQYGDGIFTTIKVEQGAPQLWPLHYQRLTKGLQILGIDFNSWDKVQDAINCQAQEAQNAVLKLLISRGEGGRGYQTPEMQQPLWILTVHPMPEHYQKWQQQGIELGLSEIQLARQPKLAGIKHLNRLEQVLVKMHVPDDGPEEMLVCDTQGMIVECSASNLFWQINGVWYTPDLCYCGVAGVMRERILQHFKTVGSPVMQVQASPRILQQAQAVLLCNSLMGIVPVRRYKHYNFAIDSVRQLAREIL